ncbi:MAG: type IV toxin-antitoxin system AbiEi family antitoxin domain-containing protein [Pseudomonadota bacterium]
MIQKRPKPIEKRSPEDVLQGVGLFRTADAVKLGISQPTVSRLAMKGVIIRIEHGLYHHRDAVIDPSTLDFCVACTRLGADSVIGGLTALFEYVLIPQVPQQTWVMVPHKNQSKFPKYRVIHTKHDPKIGVDDHGFYRMVSIERAIIEAFRYSTKMGYQTALTAARTALKEGKTSERRLQETAKLMGLWQVMVKNWEAITTK